MKIYGNRALWCLTLLGAAGCAGAPDASDSEAEPPAARAEQEYTFGSYYGGPGGSPWQIGNPWGNHTYSYYGTYNGVGTTIDGYTNLTSWTMGGCEGSHPGSLAISGEIYLKNRRVLAPASFEWKDKWPLGIAQGGVLKSHRCPLGQYIIGVWGRSGYYVDTLSFVCGTPDHSQVDYGTDFCGTSTGGSFFLEYCPIGFVASGFTGRGGAWMDGIQMYCNPPYIPPAVIP